MKPLDNAGFYTCSSGDSPERRRLPAWSPAVREAAMAAGGSLSWADLDSLTRLSPGLVAVSTYEEGRIVTANADFCKFVGYDAKTLIGSTTDGLSLWADPDRRRDLALSLSRHGRVDQLSLPIRTRSGDVRCALLSFRVLEVEGTRCVYGLGFDITDRERKEAALARDARRAQAESAAKTQFLSVTSHELRTPLSIIIGYLQLLEEELRDGESAASARQLEYLDRVARGSDTLLHLVNQLLDLQRIEAGRLEINIEPFDLLDEIHTLYADFADVAGRKGIRWRVDADETVPNRMHGDVQLLRRVLHNLTGNAFKFTTAGSVTLNVRGTLGPGGERRVLFDVIDSGCGIARHARERIFSPFQQEGGEKSRTYGGTGLGLAISRRIVRALGGELELAWSEEATGSCFRFWLPLSRPPASGASIK